MLSDLARDFRHGVRLLGRAPGFTALAVLTLALGVGANTAIFSVVQGLLLRPLPYDRPEQLTFMDGVLHTPDGETRFQLSYPEIADVAARSLRLSTIVPWSNAWGLSLEDREGAVRLAANFVGPHYFQTLGRQPLSGRVFVAEDHATGHDGRLVAILSEAVWRQAFGGDPTLIGRNVRLQGRPFTIVGIMPDEFQDVARAYQERIDVWVPVERVTTLFGVDLTARASRLFWVVGRLANEVPLAEASQELDAISRELSATHPQTNRDFSLRVVPLSQTFFADARGPLALLLGGSIFVLAIGCANVANLLLVRSAGRTREMAIRLATGATRGRLVRQLLAESLVLASLAAAAGLLLASWLTPLLLPLSGITGVDTSRVTIDSTVLAVSVATALACGLLFGLAPAWRAFRVSVRGATTSASQHATARSRTGLWLAGLEVTAAFVLASGAIVMLESFRSLTRTDLAFRHDHLLTARIELPQDRYPTPAARVRLARMARERLEALPGVEHVILWGPSMFARSTWVAFIAPREAADPDARTMVSRHSINAGALADLGIPLIAGRDFSSADTLDAPPVAIVSQATAARLWPGQQAVGRQFRTLVAGQPVDVSVVGIAADARHRGRFRFSTGAAALEPQLDLYLPFEQRPNGLLTIGIRTRHDESTVTPLVRGVFAALDPVLSVHDIAALANRLRAEAAPVGAAALLMNVYGGLALLLAAIGVYGVLAAGVASRARELGIRAALGAVPQRLLTGVVREGLMVTAGSVVVGVGIAWALGRVVGSWIFAVSPTEPRLLAVAAMLLITAALAAGALPARRAARTDPARVLRGE